jgi:hypothetical protein
VRAQEQKAKEKQGQKIEVVGEVGLEPTKA